MKNNVSIVTCSIVAICVSVYVPAWFSPNPVPIKTILIWNGETRLESAASFGEGVEAFVRQQCPEPRCQITSNRSLLPFERYDAVVMNMYDIEISVLPEDWGYKRCGHQRYVLLSQESPSTIYVHMDIFVNYFNWSMSYRHDADIILRYGRVKPVKKAPISQSQIEQLIKETHGWSKDFLANKSKTVVWMASHCHTDAMRETYVHELSKYIDVDVYGACGNFTCPRDEIHWISDPVCFDVLAAKYKFYLSFENSFCKEYVTEKFFEALARDILPVVYGAADYSQLAPPHSFINAMDYTPRQLARLLHRLEFNKTLYNEYFWWKEHYRVETGMRKMIRDAYCHMCQQLHQDSTLKVYTDIQDHWNWDVECFEVTTWIVNNTVDLTFL